MPINSPPVFPRWPLPVRNETSPTKTPAPIPPDEQPAETPSTIPEPVYKSVTVVPADRLPASTSHAPIPQYPGSGATLLQGYCTEPAYTILDGPTAVWVPVVGCISSKTDCCPTSTKSGSGAAPTSDGGPGGGDSGAGNGAEFPISSMPSQGTLTGCPKDYHTVDGTACCPSSYWLWSAEMGGQVPCYSSLKSEMTPPPIPDTLVQDATRTDSATSQSTGSAVTRVPALTMTQKPTSAIVNVAYAMQYHMVSEPKPSLKKEAKIGIGVGAGGGAVLIAVLALLVVRKFLAHKKTRDSLAKTSVSQRFGHGVDMSRVAHEGSSMSRTHGGAKYTGVSTRGVDY